MPNILASGLKSTHYSDSEILIHTGLALDTALRHGFGVRAESTFKWLTTIVCSPAISTTETDEDSATDALLHLSHHSPYLHM